MFKMINTYLNSVLKEMGLSEKHGLVYRTLLAHKGTTPLRIARETKLNRSSIYRYLEDLRGKGLVDLVLGDKSTQYTADPSRFNQYLANEEVRIENLKGYIPTLIKQLDSVSGKEKESEVKYYHGVEGLKQMLWNVVSQKEEYVGLGYKNWNDSVGKNYAEKLRNKNMETGVKSREISNDPDNDFEYTDLGNDYQRIYEHRRIDPKILEIKHDTYIYGEVFAYYHHYQGEYFGVEIHNGEIARTERQMFEILWKLGV